jgi:hypothetical protein
MAYFHDDDEEASSSSSYAWSLSTRESLEASLLQQTERFTRARVKAMSAAEVADIQDIPRLASLSGPDTLARPQASS